MRPHPDAHPYPYPGPYPGSRKPRLDHASAEIRNAVRALLATVSPEPAECVVAVSGGADSLALAAACAHLQRTTPYRFYAVTVDHQLQHDSAAVAQRVAHQLASLGLTSQIVTVDVPASSAGTEAAARQVRYAALAALATERGAAGVLTGHTLNDQAESVLLGLARGSGARSLAGMRAVSTLHEGVLLLRPLLGITRDQTRTSAKALGLNIWDDPMNVDPAYARVRVRTELLPALTDALGAGVIKNLARTAQLLAADADELDRQAASLAPGFISGDTLDSTAGNLAPALLQRVVRDWLLGLCPPTELTAGHIERVCQLVTGQRTGAVSVPAAAEVRAVRSTSVQFVPSKTMRRGPRDNG